MATIREHLINGIFQRGIFEDDAKSIVQDFVSDEMSAPLSGRWDEPTTNYPPTLIRTIEVAADDFVVRWMDENAPKHWARPLFASVEE